MRAVLIFVVAVSIALVVPGLVGCDGGSSSSDDSSSGIVAAWTLVSWRAVGNDVPGGDITLTPPSGMVSANIEFKSDNTAAGRLTFQGEVTPVDGTWSVSGNTLTLSDSEGSMALTFSVSGSTLTLSFAEEDEDVTSTLTFSKV